MNGDATLNAAGFPVLSLVTFLPLLGVAILMTLRGENEAVAKNARWTALWASLLTFLISLVLWTRFDIREAGYQFVEHAEWLPGFGIGYRMGVDGISVLFVLLSTALTPICILASWDTIKTRVREYMAAFLILETMMVGMFSATDFLLFYMFFEGVLIPMYLIIGVWGGPRRVYASLKFFFVHVRGLGADAAGAACHVAPGRYHRHYGPGAHAFQCAYAGTGCSSPFSPRSR